MKKITTLFLVSVLWAWSVSSTVTTTNNGDGTTSLRATYTVPTASVADVRDDICRGIGWTATVTCTQALVTASKCTAGQLNTQITNPETCIQAIDRTLKTILLGLRKAGEVKEAEETFITPIRVTDRSSDIQ